MWEILTIIGAVVGAVLGLRYKLFILAPVLVLGWVVVAVDGVAGGHGVWWTVGAMVTVSVSLQVGYLGVFVLRWVKHDALATRHCKASWQKTPNPKM
jgi:hypothetical protein